MRLFYLLFGLTLSMASFAQFSIKESKAFQKKLNEAYKGEKSPLKPEDKKKFRKLPFFPVDEKFIVEARLELTPEDTLFKMRTTTDRLPEYRRYGILHFEIDGQAFQLNVYQNPELNKKPGLEKHLFLPFKDLTCGSESYGGGRYLDLEIPEENSIILDFNRAYNPYCAYNEKYSCPIVTEENFLETEIRAGVKAPSY